MPSVPHPIYRSLLPVFGGVDSSRAVSNFFSSFFVATNVRELNINFVLKSYRKLFEPIDNYSTIYPKIVLKL
jgi:hypothetical protein